MIARSAKADAVRQADRRSPAHPAETGRHGAGDPEGRPGGVAHRPDEGRRHAAPQQISFGELNNVREAIAIAREARTILGANGITLDHSPLRNANNLESVMTYEGTSEVHTLIMGQAITGLAAFR